MIPKQRRALYSILVTCLLIPLAFLIPILDSTRAPFFDLTAPMAQIAYWLSFSAGTIGAPFLVLSLLALLYSPAKLSSTQRLKATGTILFLVVILVGGGAAINEHLIKPSLKIPRPNIVWLANNTDTLGMTVTKFYAVGDKAARRAPLAAALERTPIVMSSHISAHWLSETGYSSPSGHAFTALFIATFFLLLSTTLLNSKWQGLFYLLLPWALAVCYARPILRVHTPLDITLGGLQGLIIGIFAWWLAYTLFAAMRLR